MNLKIAAIVLVVIVAVLILLNIPYWLNEIAKHRQERAIFALTPELVISRCGKPLSDVTHEHPVTPGTNFVFRELNYHGGTGTLALFFVRLDQGQQPERWVFSAMQNLADHSRYGTAKSKLAALPCLLSN